MPATEPPSSGRVTGARSLPLAVRRLRGARRPVPGWGGSAPPRGNGEEGAWGGACVAGWRAGDLPEETFLRAELPELGRVTTMLGKITPIYGCYAPQCGCNSPQIARLRGAPARPRAPAVRSAPGPGHPRHCCAAKPHLSGREPGRRRAARLTQRCRCKRGAPHPGASCTLCAGAALPPAVVARRSRIFPGVSPGDGGLLASPNDAVASVGRPTPARPARSAPERPCPRPLSRGGAASFRA
jgi:hypothetical protein